MTKSSQRPQRGPKAWPFRSRLSRPMTRITNRSIGSSRHQLGGGPAFAFIADQHSPFRNRNVGPLPAVARLISLDGSGALTSCHVGGAGPKRSGSWKCIPPIVIRRRQCIPHTRTNFVHPAGCAIVSLTSVGKSSRGLFRPEGRHEVIALREIHFRDSLVMCGRECGSCPERTKPYNLTWA